MPASHAGAVNVGGAVGKVSRQLSTISQQFEGQGSANNYRQLADNLRKGKNVHKLSELYKNAMGKVGK